MRHPVLLCLIVSLFSTLISLLHGADLRVATYNLKNYLVMDRHVGARWRPSYPKPENEKVIVRQIIKEITPDILILQEMGSIDFLEELRADMAQEGIHYNYAVHMRGEDLERHLAVLSKYAPHEVVKHKDLDFKYFDRRERVKRGMLEMCFKLDGDSLVKIFALHLKSRYTDDDQDPESNIRRTKEAEACRDRVIERTHDQGVERYLIAGDFNDHPASAALRRFYRRGQLEIGSLVPASDSRGEVWTYFYEKEGRYELVDGFVASPDLMSHIKTGRAHIVDRPGALVGSDHRMVYMDLSGARLVDLPPAAAAEK